MVCRCVCHVVCTTLRDLREYLLFVDRHSSLPLVLHLGYPRGQYKLRNLFSGAFDRTPDVSPLPIMVPLHTKWQLEAIAALLAAAKKPVFIVASQATLFDGRARSADEVCTSRCMS
jgi:hypothetical protein